MSFIKASALGPLTASNTATIVDPATPASGSAYLGPIVNFATIATTSGTAIDTTGIPSWAKRITVVFNGVSTTGTYNYIMQLGTAGGIVSSGYTSTMTTIYNSASPGATSYTNGFNLTNPPSSSATFYGLVTIMNAGSNAWSMSSNLCETSGPRVMLTTGGVTLSGALTTIRLTQGNVDTFDAGSINIYYE